MSNLKKKYIYHCVPTNYWAAFKDKAVYFPAQFEEEGFIHACREDQMEHVVTNYFIGIPEITVLKIDIDKLTAELKIEPANGQSFPHIYGVLNTDAIENIVTIKQEKMAKQHHYQIKVAWTGNLGEGTKNYQSYSRNHEIQAEGKPIILGSSDPAFRGDANCYNPEDLFVSTLASCHMLWYLHFCATNKITVVHYVDIPEGIMVEQENGMGAFERVTLKPQVVIQEKEQLKLAKELHEKAHKFCFIANSVNFPVLCDPFITTL